MKKIETVKIQWNSVKEIEKAEAKKLKLENLGYNLIDSDGETLTYELPPEDQRKLIADNLEYCSDEMIQLINDLIDLPNFPNKHEMLKFAGEEDGTIDSAYPIDYFRKIEEIYPNIAKGNFIFDYRTQKFGELVNVNDLVFNRLMKAINH